MSQPQPKPGILDIHPYLGGEGRSTGTEKPLRLASNENPLGCSTAARAAYEAAVSDLHRYPDGAAADLRQALATTYSLPVDQIVCGAGSDELILLLASCYAGVGDEIIYSQYGFLRYAICAKSVGAVPVAAPEKELRADVAALLAAVTPKTKMMMLANPNNPTGSYLTKAELQQLRHQLPEHVLLVVDAAYAEFVDAADYEDGSALVSQNTNVVMLRTFSKIYGLAALRLGWAYCPENVAAILNRVRSAFNVSVPAQAAGVAALADRAFVQKTIQMTAKGRDQIGQELGQMGITAYPSVGNFILADFGAGAEDLRLALKDQNIFIRQMGAYGLPNCLRITVSTAEDNDRLLAAVRKAV